MDMPLQLRDAITNLASGYKQAQLKNAAQALTDRYKNESGQGRRLVTKNIETAAYTFSTLDASPNSLAKPEMEVIAARSSWRSMSLSYSTVISLVLICSRA